MCHKNLILLQWSVIGGEFRKPRCVSSSHEPNSVQNIIVLVFVWTCPALKGLEIETSKDIGAGIRKILRGILETKNEYTVHLLWHKCSDLAGIYLGYMKRLHYIIACIRTVEELSPALSNSATEGGVAIIPSPLY